MIEPVIATALILSILALIAYFLQPEQPHHQRHYYHQVRRARVMADPQRRSRAGGVDRGAEVRGGGGGWKAYERENEEGEGEDEGRGEVAIGVREGGLIGRGFVEDGVEDVDAAASFGPGDVLAQEPDMHAAPGSRGSSPPVILITTPESDTPSTILISHDVEHDAKFKNLGDNTLDQQRRQRVRCDEALRMHSYGGSQYVGGWWTGMFRGAQW